jgi:hypothetical protein
MDSLMLKAGSGFRKTFLSTPRIAAAAGTDAMIRRNAIIDERDLRRAVEMLVKATNGRPEAGAVAALGTMRGLNHCTARCPRRESNSHEVALGGF